MLIRVCCDPGRATASKRPAYAGLFCVKITGNMEDDMKEKRRVGRPSKYNDELQAEADRYIYDYEQQEDVIPSAAGMCVWLGISRSTLHEWERTYPEFSNTLCAVKELQEKTALNKGLTGVFNSTIVKLILANHGYSDKQAVDHTTAGQPMQSTQDAVLDALRRKHDDT